MRRAYGRPARLPSPLAPDFGSVLTPIRSARQRNRVDACGGPGPSRSQARSSPSCWSSPPSPSRRWSRRGRRVGWAVVGGAAALLCAGLGAVVARRVRDNPVGPLLVGVGAGVALTAAREAAFFALAEHEQTAVRLNWLVALLAESSSWLFAALGLLLLYFPDGSASLPPLARRRGPAGGRRGGAPPVRRRRHRAVRRPVRGPAARVRARRRCSSSCWRCSATWRCSGPLLACAAALARQVPARRRAARQAAAEVAGAGGRRRARVHRGLPRRGAR